MFKVHQLFNVINSNLMGKAFGPQWSFFFNFFEIYRIKPDTISVGGTETLI
jgi:hypothetical protein